MDNNYSKDLEEVFTTVVSTLSSPKYRSLLDRVYKESKKAEFKNLYKELTYFKDLYSKRYSNLKKKYG